jgi:hypothetical protein
MEYKISLSDLLFGTIHRNVQRAGTIKEGASGGGDGSSALEVKASPPSSPVYR